jgi:phage terminase large subunit
MDTLEHIERDSRGRWPEAKAGSVDAEFPAPLQCLFEPKRYKVLWGGRGAGRSWGVSRALLINGTSRPLRVLCARELQNSISESVHKILSDQITALGLGDFYDIQAKAILGKNGTSFAFEGIKNNVNKIKSYEGIDICWVEEANKVSRNSWGVLIPTIRKEQSEIWMTFNPELETDYTYVRFVKEADPSSMIVVKMTWRDNPFFPEVLREELERDKKFDYDHYLNIWEGHCVQVLEGAIYAKELRRATEEGRICNVPYDREQPVDTFWDLGRADATAIWFAQRVAMQYRVLDYYSGTGEGDVAHYLREIQQKGYLLGTAWLPHDARAKRLGTKRTIQEQIHQAGYKTRIVPNISRTDGINAARLIFPNCWFDAERCDDGIQSLRHYRYRVIDGQYSNEPVHDWASDGADAFRYLALSLRERTDNDRAVGVLERLRGLVESTRRDRELEATEVEFSGRPGRARWGGSGWMR